MRRLGYPVIIMVLALIVCVPASAQDQAWSIGLGASGGTISPDGGGSDIDITGYTLFGRWQHQANGWGAMLEIRDGEDDENFVEFDYMQVNAYGTYTWLRDGLARPFVKAGLSNSEIDVPAGPNEDDTALILGGGVEVGRGRWAFHAGLDATRAEIDGDDIDITNLTLGAVFRF